MKSQNKVFLEQKKPLVRDLLRRWIVTRNLGKDLHSQLTKNYIVLWKEVHSLFKEYCYILIGSAGKKTPPQMGKMTKFGPFQIPFLCPELFSRTKRSSTEIHPLSRNSKSQAKPPSFVVLTPELYSLAISVAKIYKILIFAYDSRFECSTCHLVLILK